MRSEDLKGRIVDFDSHLMLFPDTLDSILGEAHANKRIRQMVDAQGMNPTRNEAAVAASRARARADVWSVKGWGAHGAQVAADRVDALDQMGIARQLLFSIGMNPVMYADDPEAMEAIRRYNDYVLDWAKETDERVLPVCLLNMQHRDGALAEARRVVDGGARYVQLTYGIPWAGLAPAAAEWDPLWAMLAEAGVPAVFHGGSSRPEFQMINPAWLTAAQTLAPPADDPQAQDPHAMPFVWTVIHLPAELALTFMVLGGVFERHPGLRFGVIEMGASWVAPWCERMDVMAAGPCEYLSRQLPMKPSEYVRRHVRVTPFVFEPVGSWIERSGLQEVYVFSTDYPHIEGGLNPIESFYSSLAPLGDEAVEAFFITNGLELLPS